MNKKHRWTLAFLLLVFVLAASCATVSNEPPRITLRGEYLADRSMWPRHVGKKHYGIDYYTAAGTPILAAADGTVVQIVDRDIIMPNIWYGIWVTIGHGHYRGKMLYAYYGHFEKLFVSINDRVKRGQVLGLAAALPARFKKKIRDMEPHLHFELFQPKEGFGITGNLQLVLKTGDPTIWRTVYNPDDFWLGGKSQCFDGNKDYSNYTNLEFTHPVACGEYGRALVNRLKNK